MVFRKTDIGFSESSTFCARLFRIFDFLARVFRAGAKIGRGWGHARKYPHSIYQHSHISTSSTAARHQQPVLGDAPSHIYLAINYLLPIHKYSASLVPILVHHGHLRPVSPHPVLSSMTSITKNESQNDVCRIAKFYSAEFFSDIPAEWLKHVGVMVDMVVTSVPPVEFAPHVRLEHLDSSHPHLQTATAEQICPRGFKDVHPLIGTIDCPRLV